MITLTGGDRKSWLHSISTQHVSELPEGASTENLSLDGQGRVEDHWIQTELGGVTYLDTEAWRGEPLLAYLRAMVFWSDVTPDAADMVVLSLLGPRLSEPATLDVLGVDELPAEMTAVPLPGRIHAQDDQCAHRPNRAGCAGAAAAIERLVTPADSGRVRAAGYGPTKPIGWPRVVHDLVSTPTSAPFPTRSAGSAIPAWAPFI
ncbi:aminomethyltransferase folate-binding domain protein [Mycobacterium xenopi 4042]|uniref:Aminomethyltransferase folate-binding domain protein n=1 Tax=Mycobacterium xenopi 4042 TaxID=1299334 RepID=X7ZWV5_MYCXE|nr:aminomethyltransferase folate-binding domain protein [Mycobacterium xenopi 4042]